MKRRKAIIMGISSAGLLTAGCLSQLPWVRYPGELSALVVTNEPPNITPIEYPQRELENTYISRVVEKALEKSIGSKEGSKWAIVRVPEWAIEEVENTYFKLPAQESIQPDGRYVTYKDRVVAIQFAILQ